MKLLVLSLLTASALAAGSNVESLTDSTFDDFIADNDRVLVEFYAPWCGHCKNLAPEFAKAADTLADEGSETKLADVDATEAKSLASKFGVQGFPTLKYFVNGKAQDYGGGRSADTIVSWLKKRALPAVSDLADDAAADAFAADNEMACIGRVAPDSAEAKVLAKFADNFRDDCTTGAVNAGTVPSFELRKKGGDALVMEGDFTAENLETFFGAERFPLIDEIGPENYKLYMDRGLPIAWLAVDADNDDAKAAMEVEAAKYKGALSVVWVDAAKFKQHVEGNLGIKKNPGVMIIRDSDNKKFKYDGEVSSADDLAAFFSGFSEGTLEAFLKSQPVPEDNDGDVTVVVGKNFDDVALNSEKYVLLEFYAPWCGHCKKLAPIWDELGAKFADDDRVTIAKCDATENDTPEKVQGFPTIFFYGTDNKAVKYEGGRELDNFVEYMEEQLEGSSTAGYGDKSEL